MIIFFIFTGNILLKNYILRFIIKFIFYLTNICNIEYCFILNLILFLYYLSIHFFKNKINKFLNFIDKFLNWF